MIERLDLVTHVLEWRGDNKWRLLQNEIWLAEAYGEVEPDEADWADPEPQAFRTQGGAHHVMGQVVDGVPSAVRADDVEVQVHVIGGVWGASWRQPASTCTVSWDDIDNDGAFQSGISITRHLSADYVPPDRDAPVEDDPSTGPVRPSDPIRRTRTYPLWDKVFATEIGSCLRLVMTDLWPDHPELLGIVVTGNDVWLHDSTGSGVGLVTEWIEMCGLERTTELVADAVQEAAIDALWGERRTPTWPTCPDHPTTHALSVRTVGDAASWVCPAFDRVIARIGELHG